ncbi:hypothetical protein, partial [Cecembia rubra]|uniref:hypothetical protein n=1 Tax=Cecembia rubra TaxID=1485585 RepID=UPI00271454C1
MERDDKITLMEDFSVIYESKRSLDIYDSKGLSHATIKLPEDKLNKIQYFEATVVSLSTGKTIKKIRLKDLK